MLETKKRQWQVLGLYKRLRTRFLCYLLTSRGFQFFYISHFTWVRANLTVRRHISVFFIFFVIFAWVMRKEKGGKRGKKKMVESWKRGQRKGQRRGQRRVQKREKRGYRGRFRSYWGSLWRRWEVWGRIRVPLSSQESQGLCYIHWQLSWVCEGAPRAVRQGAWTFQRQTEEGGSLGRNLFRTEAPALWCQKVVWVTENSLWQDLQATVWASPNGDDQETVLGLPADGFP